MKTDREKLFHSLLGNTHGKVGLKQIVKANSPAGLKVMPFPNLGKGGGSDQKEQERLLAENKRLKQELRERDTRLQQMEQKLPQDKKEAWQNGYEEGEKQGFETARQESLEEYNNALGELQGNVQSALSDFVKKVDQNFAEIEEFTLELSTIMVTRIFNQIAEKEEKLIQQIVREAMKYLGQNELITLRVHPDDYKIVDENRDFWLPVTQNIKQLEIKEDDRIQRGGCYVDTEGGSVDMRKETIIEQLQETVRNWYNNQEDQDAQDGQEEQQKQASPDNQEKENDQ